MVDYQWIRYTVYSLPRGSAVNKHFGRNSKIPHTKNKFEVWNTVNLQRAILATQNTPIRRFYISLISHRTLGGATKQNMKSVSRQVFT